jgi:putative flippase GtrA
MKNGLMAAEQKTMAPEAPGRTHGRLITTSGIASAITGAAEYFLYILLVELASVHYVASAVSAGVFGIVLNYFLNRFWAFRDTVPGGLGQFLRYAVVTGIGIAGGAAILYFFVDFFAIPYWIGWALQNLAVFLVWTYPTNRYFIFPAAATSQGGPAS